MHLRSVTLKGFKSFPHRTRLEFAPGVSVVVGPNGSGKSNVTEAVLWALGEQSPLAVRGQTMKDVIFAGGHGLSSSSSAEVEVVIDNSDGSLPVDFSEISIVRKLDRDGEGEYRLNGARCRLVDVIEVLSDSGLGKEMHSVVSQGKVETIVHSRPRDRRLMIEEAAGLGKHRKRRRRAQLKLERTEENLARALDVEREARSRLRPLKRQAEAAELHQRLERQSLEARMELARERTREIRLQLGEAESRAGAAQEERSEAERLLAGVASRREEAEEAFAAHSRTREELQSRLFAARSAAERIGLRLERAGDQERAALEGAERRRRALAAAEEALATDDGAGEVADRIAALEQELAGLEEGRAERLRAAVAGLEQGLAGERAEHERLTAVAGERRAALERAEAGADSARRARREAEAAVESARAAAARVGSDLAAVNHFLRAAGPRSDGPTLAEGLRVRPGLEAALAAALGPRLSASVVEDVAAGQRLLDRAGERGGLALVAGGGTARDAGAPPAPGATPLLDCVDPAPELREPAQRLLTSVWLVDSLDALPRSFPGLAVTAAGRSLDGRSGELAQAPAGGAERVLEERNRRDELVTACERAAAAESEARAEAGRVADAVKGADAAREEADVALRRALRDEQGAAEAVERSEWLIASRRQAPDEGPEAVRAAELAAEVRGERRLAEESERRRAKLASDAARLRAGVERHEALARDSARAAHALRTAREAVAERRDALETELREGAAAGEETAAALRALAHEEAELQARLKRAGEALVSAEVAAQQVRDATADAQSELNELAGGLGLEPAPAEEPLSEERAEELRTRVERLARRREQLGPVNPLAGQEYEEAVAHVEELEGQRSDLENALAELQGLIKETDQRIRTSFEETFEATARNFEDVVQHLFPGGRGRLRLVHPDGPRPVLGGEEPPADEQSGADAESDSGEDESAAAEPGVEVEVTPAGKAMKRLSLLSGGEKSLVALAFMFAVFLARPCPFYILDEVEAALDDLNIDRFLELIRRYSDRAQFIVVTHQKRTMDAADCLYGVSMGGDGVSHVVSRKLEEHQGIQAA